MRSRVEKEWSVAAVALVRGAEMCRDQGDRRMMRSCALEAIAWRKSQVRNRGLVQQRELSLS